MTMLFLKNNKGQISLFLCIISVALLFFALVLVENSKNASSQAHTGLALENSLESVLAGYDTRLKEQYGLFGLLYKPDIEDTLEKYLDLNLNTPRFNSFHITDVECAPSSHLSDDAVIGRQILDFMKYRALIGLADDMARLFNDTRDFNKAGVLLTKKIDLEQVMSQMGGVMHDIAGYLTGTAKDGGISGIGINGLTADNILGAAMEGLNRLFRSHVLLNWKITEINDKIADLSVLLEEQTDEDDRKQTKSSIVQLQADLSEYLSQSENKRHEILENIKGINQKYLKPCLESNKKALECLETLSEKLDGTFCRIDDIMTFVQNLEGLASGDEDPASASGSFLPVTVSAVQEEIDGYRQMLPDKETLDRLASNLRRNTTVLNMAIECTDEFSRIVDPSGDSTAGLTEFTKRMNEIVAQYCSCPVREYIPWYDENRETPAGGQAAPGDKVLQAATDGFGEYSYEKKDCVSLNELGIDCSMLPSRRKPEDDSGTDGSTDATADAAADDAADDGFTVGNGETILAGDAGMALKGLGSANSFLSGLEYSRDKAFLILYLTGMLKNTVAGQSGSGSDKSLAGIEWPLVDTVFLSEAEYIICGNQSEKINRLLTEGMILSVRFGFNLIHVFTDPQKRQLAAAIASAASVWWSGGIAVPLVSSLLMCSWAMAESIMDVNDLLKGKAVPLYKTKSQWRLDIGLGAVDAGKGISGPVLRYVDYLRLIMMVKGNDVMMTRLMDLIEINMGMQKMDIGLDDYYTRLTATVSISYNDRLSKVFYDKYGNSISENGNGHGCRSSLSMGY